MPSWQQKATGADAIARASVPPRVVWDPGMHRRLLHGNRESSVTALRGRSQGPNRGKARAEGASNTREGAVRLTDSTEEVGEQGGARRGGADGGKRWDREECGTAKHGPDTEPGSRVTSAGSHTRGRYQEQEGTPHGAPASCRHRLPAVGLRQFEEARSARRR